MANKTLKTLSKKNTCSEKGIYYKEIEETTVDDKGIIKTKIVDKMFYIRYKDNLNKDKWISIGKYSEGIREKFCSNKRIEILNNLKLGEQPQIIKRRQKKNIITFDNIAMKFFESVKNINKDVNNSIRRYSLHIKPYIGNCDITNIEFREVEKIQRDKLVTHKPKTVNHITTLIGTIINYAIQKEDILIQKNPMVKIKNLKIDNKREKYLTIDEIKKLLENVHNDETLNLFTRLSLSTGGRLSTIMNIRKKDINLIESTINLYDFKNESSYTGFITDDLIPILNHLLPNLEPNELLVSGYAKDTVRNKIGEILDELFNKGLDIDDSKNRAVTHTLRHTFASQLAIIGTPIFTIQKLMNHKDINMTLRYAKLSPDNGRINVKSLYKDS